MKLPDAIFAQHIAVLGKTGSGKSSVLRSFTEQLLDDKQPICILDPKGDWWGLKSSASGKSAGYPVVIFGGEHADVPINAHSGSHVAELIATGNRPCIIDLGGWMVGERTRFFVDFASTLFRTTRGKRYMVIDEVHNFAPQGKVLDPDAGKMLHWANRLASEGRGKGLTILSASQRPQKVHKDFLTCAETLIAMRVIHKLDRDAIKDWIDGAGDPAKGREVLDTLAGMERGEAWVWSPEIKFGPKRIRFPMFRTYDSFAPKANDGTAKLKGWASVDLDEVTAKLAKVVDEAKANDPAELKKQIADLNRQLKAKPAPAADPKAVERAVGAAVAERDRHWKGELSKAEKAHGSVVNRLTKIHQLSTLNGDATIAVEQPKIIGITTPKIVAPQLSYAAPKTSARTIRQDQSTDSGEFKFGKAEQSILRAFYWTRDEQSTPAKIGFYSGYSHKSGSFANTISRLRSAGLVEGWNITDAGSVMAAEYAEAKPSGSELREWLRPKISKCENEILDTLMEAGGNRLSPEQIAAATPSQYSHGSGSFANALARLRSLEAAEGYGGQGVKAADVFFE